MPRCCVVGGCFRNHIKNPETAFFLFPREEQLRRAWTEFVITTRRDYHPGKWSQICEEHFDASCIDESSLIQKKLGRKKYVSLKHGSVPTKKAPYPGLKTTSSSTTRSAAAATTTETAKNHQRTGQSCTRTASSSRTAGPNTDVHIMDGATPSKQAKVKEPDDNKPKPAPSSPTNQPKTIIRSRRNLSPQDSTFEILQQIDICQGELENLNEAASEEIINIEEKFNSLRKPYIDQRSEAIQKIPNFWICTFVNHPLLAPRLNEEDEECLHYLRQLKVDYREDLKTGFIITFYFAKNPFFENETISKEFMLTDSGEPMSQSTIIQWKPGMDITKKLNPLTGRTEGTSGSFFSWFTDHVDAGNDEVADVLRDDLWSNPLQYYLIPDIDDSLDRSLLDSLMSDDDMQMSSPEVSRADAKVVAVSLPNKTREEKKQADSEGSKIDEDKSVRENSTENHENVTHNTS